MKISFVSALALIFITLKLCGVITWSWWWILSPFWVVLAVVLAIVLGSLVASLIVSAQESATQRRRRKSAKNMERHEFVTRRTP